MPDFQCTRCARSFSVPQPALDKFPGWVPKVCRDCKGSPAAGAKPAAGFKSKARPFSGNGGKSRRGPVEEALTTAEVLARYSAGPDTGVFTDGAAHPNPGPGGWGAVYVIDGRVVAERSGHERSTTNNRMELTALMNGLSLVPAGVSTVLWTDSELCVNTFTRWAKAWQARGWKRKEGEIKNLELVRPIYEQLASRPELQLRWIGAHQGFRWNEYADSLATSYRRPQK